MVVTRDDIRKYFDMWEEEGTYDTKSSYDWMISIRWPDGIKCPRCASDRFYHTAKHTKFKCAQCRLNYSPTSGTIFDNKKLPMGTIAAALGELLETPNITSVNLGGILSMTQKTAYYFKRKVKPFLRDGYFEFSDICLLR